jgi:hypothetical protein
MFGAKRRDANGFRRLRGAAVTGAIILLLAACGLPMAERFMGQAGEDGKSIVVLRVLAKSPEGVPMNYAAQLAAHVVNESYGLFLLEQPADTPIDAIQPLSEAALTEGWLYFPVQPGRAYTLELRRRAKSLFAAIRGDAPPLRWAIDVPGATSLVYAGTLNLIAEKNFALIGRHNIEVTDIAFPDVSDERQTAAALAEKTFPDLGTMRTALMTSAYGDLPRALAGTPTPKPLAPAARTTAVQPPALPPLVPRTPQPAVLLQCSTKPAPATQVLAKPTLTLRCSPQPAAATGSGAQSELQFLCKPEPVAN